jgi:mRNA interferase MazF
MRGGDIVLLSLPQADGHAKNRPALVLCPVRPFGDLLVCGISSQVRQTVEGFDEVISPDDPDFTATGLIAASLVRLGFLATVPLPAVKGVIGTIDTARHRRLLLALAGYLAGQAR